MNKFTKPDTLLFDMDGVLVDTSTSYDQVVIETLRSLGGPELSRPDIFKYRNRGGLNNDWDLCNYILKEQGHSYPYAKIKATFQALYLGDETNNGLIRTEQWLPQKDIFQALAKDYKLGIVTGRPRYEAGLTLDQSGIKNLFTTLVSMDDIQHQKPHPEGLQLATKNIGSKNALYMGDNLDDARAAQEAAVPFIGIAPPKHPDPDSLQKHFQQLDALCMLRSVNQIKDYLNDLS